MKKRPTYVIDDGIELPGAHQNKLDDQAIDEINSGTYTSVYYAAVAYAPKYNLEEWHSKTDKQQIDCIKNCVTRFKRKLLKS